MSDGTKITPTLVQEVLDASWRPCARNSARPITAQTRFDEAGDLFLSVSTTEEFVDFLTLPAYERID